MGRLTAQVNLVPCAPAPTSLFMALCDGGPPTMERLGAPDQGVDPRVQLAVGPIGGDHLTCPTSIHQNKQASMSQAREVQMKQTNLPAPHQLGPCGPASI